MADAIAVEGGAESAAEEVRQYTEAELASLPLADLMGLRRDLEEHIDTEAERRHQTELRRVRDSIASTVREEVIQEQENKWLTYLKSKGDAAAFMAEYGRIEIERTQRKNAANQQEQASQAAIDRMAQRYVTPLMEQLRRIDAPAADKFATKTYAGGEAGVLECIDELTDAIAEAKAGAKTKAQAPLVAATERKAALAEMAGESPEISAGKSGAAGPRNKAWFDNLTLPERQAFRRQHTTEYNALMAAS